MTVSRALRKQTNISPETQKKIQAIADELGYRPNPLVSALMTYRRAAKPVESHLSIGFITNFPARDEWKKSKLYESFYQGVAESADRHGYGVEVFWLREPSSPCSRGSGSRRGGRRLSACARGARPPAFSPCPRR